MEKSVFVQASDLPPEKRLAAEILLGEALAEDELLLVRSSKGRIAKAGLSGASLDQAYLELERWSTGMAARVGGVPEAELEAVIDEAVEHARHRR